MRSFVLTGLLAISAVSANLSAQAAASGRIVLPDAAYPSHYDIAIVPDAAHLSFKGSVAIELDVKTAIPAIELNAVDLVFDRVALSSRNDAPRLNFDKARETVSLAFEHPVAPGTYRLEIDYHGKINEQASGFFSLDYTAADKGKKRALFTQFENSDARRFIPCWDEPGIKSTYSLSMDVPADEMAVSNMPVESSVAAGGGMKRVRFMRTPRMSVYLLFAGIGDFERAHRMVGKTDVGVIVRRGDGARAQFALDAAAQLLPYYNDYFGVPYPLPKLDIIAAPGGSQFFSAMENWGALFHFEHAALVDPRLSTQADKQYVYTTIAHEMAHQWFGDLVTMAWWNDLWLNEGFAAWMENKASDRFHPEWKLWLQAQTETQSAMAMDAAIGTHPIVAQIKDVLQASEAFDDITYQKGAAVIHMIETYVGEDAFRAGIRAYMKDFAYGNSVSDDFWRHIEAVSSKPIIDIAHDFTLQSGVPLVSVSDVHCVQGRQTLSLAQTRFAVDESGKRGAQLWRVPVQFGTLADNTVASAVVRGKAPVSANIAACEPLLLNPGETGYYRMRYDPPSAAALAARFRTLAADDQLGLLENAVALSFVGQAPLADFFNMARALAPAADPIVWRSVASRLGEIDQLLDGQAGQTAFRAFARGLLQPAFEPLGWDVIAGESDNTALLRAELIAVLGQMGDAAVITEAEKRFAQFTQSPESLSAAVRKAALNVTAMHADAAGWDRLRALAKAAPSEFEKRDFYAWLGSGIDAKVAQRALDLALTEEAPRTLRTRLIQTVSERHPELAMDFAIVHWDRVATLLESDSRFGFVPNLASNSADRRVIERLNRFAQSQIPASVRSAVEKSLGQIRYRAQLKDRLVEAASRAAFAMRVTAPARQPTRRGI